MSRVTGYLVQAARQREFRRCGLVFTAEPKLVPVGSLSEEKMAFLLESSPRELLITEVLGEDGEVPPEDEVPPAPPEVPPEDEVPPAPPAKKARR